MTTIRRSHLAHEATCDAVHSLVWCAKDEDVRILSRLGATVHIVRNGHTIT